MNASNVISPVKNCLFIFLMMLLPGTLFAQETVCIQCHGSLPDRLGEPVKLWRESIHSTNNISCHNCHGGDPADSANAMSPSRGFLGRRKTAKYHLRSPPHRRHGGLPEKCPVSLVVPEIGSAW
jgi:hypothetical protein